MEFLELIITEHRWGGLIWYGIVGACVGSFLNVVVYRMPNNLSLIKPGSHCPNCKHPIRWWHNVPVLGWMILRGRCRDCRQKISVRYPLVELTNGLAWAGLFYWNLIDVTQKIDGKEEMQIDHSVVTRIVAMIVEMTVLQSICVSVILTGALIAYDKIQGRRAKIEK